MQLPVDPHEADGNDSNDRQESTTGQQSSSCQYSVPIPRGILRRQCSHAYLIAMPCKICEAHSVISKSVGNLNQSSIYCMMVALPMPDR